MKHKWINILSYSLIAVSIGVTAIALLLPQQLVQGMTFFSAPIYVSQSQVQLGRIELDKTANFRVLLVNNHPFAVKIINIRTSCGCTVAKTNVTSLLPFHAAAVSISVNPSAAGKSAKIVTIDTDRGSQNMTVAYNAVAGQS